MSQMTEAEKQDWQSPESVNFMEQLAIVLHPLSEEKREAFREGYRSGMVDPDANKELLVECNESIEHLVHAAMDISGGDSASRAKARHILNDRVSDAILTLNKLREILK